MVHYYSWTPHCAGPANNSIASRFNTPQNRENYNTTCTKSLSWWATAKSNGFTVSASRQNKEQEAKLIWQSQHERTIHSRAAWQTDRQTPWSFATKVCISCILCSLITIQKYWHKTEPTDRQTDAWPHRRHCLGIKSRQAFRQCSARLPRNVPGTDRQQAHSQPNMCGSRRVCSAPQR